MALEAKAIDLILSRQPEWRRTPVNNPGFDLYRGATSRARQDGARSRR